MARKTKRLNSDEAKKSLSIYAPLSIHSRFDDLIKEQKFKTRAEAMEFLLDVYDGQTIDTTPSSNSNRGESESGETAASTSSKRSSPATMTTSSKGGRGKRAATTTTTATKTKNNRRATTKKDEKSNGKLIVWEMDEVSKLRRALEKMNPSTEQQWQAVANSFGSIHSWEECKKYAVSKLRYRVKRGPPAVQKKTLRARIEQTKKLKNMLRDENGGVNDVFNDKDNEPMPILQAAGGVLPVWIDNMNVSELNTPSSGYSRVSRFDESSTSSCSTPVLLANTSLASVTNVGSTVKKRADRCMNKLQPLLSKALTIKQFSPKSTPKRVMKKKRPSSGNELAWTPLKKRQDNTETDEESYYVEDTPA